MDGWTFLDQCHTDPTCGGLPVLVISAYMDEPAAGALGVQAVVAKPFDVYLLADTVDQVLQRTN